MKRACLGLFGIGAAVLALAGCSLFARYTLTLTLEPVDGGTVGYEPFEAKFRHGEEVTLTATANADYVFAGYYDGEALLSSEATYTLTMEADEAITAVFMVDNITLAASPAEGGTITATVVSSPRGYYSGSVLSLTATANTGYDFSSWSGDATGTTNPMQVTVTGALDITAQFVVAAEEVELADTYSGSGNQSFLVDTSTAANLEYTLALGSSTADVYFVLTNTGTAAADYPTVREVSGSFGSRVAPPAVRGGVTPARPMAIRGNPLADAFYDEARQIRQTASPIARRTVPEPLFDTVGGTKTFYYEITAPDGVPSTQDPIAATCQAVVTDYDTLVTLYVYVADASYGSGAGQLTTPMVNALAAKFLNGAASDTNDIYSWDTTIFGVEWASTGLTSYDIPDTNEITILLYDIDGDGTTVYTEGGVAGFFWPKDNYTKAAIGSYSNERIMFYLDAPMLAGKDDATWEITDYWPEEIIATLAHEFQHMINYYQKEIVANATSETWVNEMCSMVAEDFISDKLAIPGPRGVDPATYTTGTAGAAANAGGYLPSYISGNQTPIAYWGGEIANYATVYAFGAYLARNFGGSLLFRDIVQNSSVGRDAVSSALTAMGKSETFASALRKFAVANLLSDDTSAAPGYRYNSGAWITADIDASHMYNLGSINLYNYVSGNQTGPAILVTLPTTVGGHAASSNLFYQAGAAATGTLVWDIALPADTRLEVVVKP